MSTALFVSAAIKSRSLAKLSRTTTETITPPQKLAGAINFPYPRPKADRNTSESNLFFDYDDFIVNHWSGTDDDRIIDDAEEVLSKKPRK